MSQLYAYLVSTNGILFKVSLVASVLRRKQLMFWDRDGMLGQNFF